MINSYLDVTYDEIMEECYGPFPTLDGILSEFVEPTPNYFTDKDFIKLINNRTLMREDTAWLKIFIYITTNSKFNSMSIKESWDYLKKLKRK